MSSAIDVLTPGSSGIPDPVTLFANLSLSALFLGVFYLLVCFLVYRTVRRVFKLTLSWNTLRIFSTILLLCPFIRGITFIIHFIIYQSIIEIKTINFIKNVIMNLLFLCPTFMFLFLYMILICIWIEIVMFSRDQFLIEHSKYGKIWKIIYIFIITLILISLIITFVLSIINHNNSFMNSMYTSLFLMDFLVPWFCKIIIYLILIIMDLCGFPY